MSEPLDLEPIWGRLARYRLSSSAETATAADDVASLLVEVERLRAEIGDALIHCSRSTCNWPESITPGCHVCQILNDALGGIATCEDDA